MSRSREPDRPRGRRLDGGDIDRLASTLDAAADQYAAGRLEAAADLYESALRQRPDDIRPLYSLGLIDLRRRRYDAARRRFKAVLRRQADHFPATHNLGVTEQALGGWAEAAAAYRRAVALRPEAAESRFSLAIAEGVMGRVERAVDLYRTLATEPAHRARALNRLAILRPKAVSEDELVSLRDFAAGRQSEEAPMNRDERTASLFALAGVLEARGEFETAWQAYAAGNAAKRQSLTEGPVDGRPATIARTHAEAVARMKRLFTVDFLAAHSGDGDAKARPIFIIGFPRSGSSLIEQILASHPKVRGMGESDTLAAATRGRFPASSSTPPEPSRLRRLAADYLAGQMRRGWDGRSRLVDKTLDSHLQVGLIHLMFPKATILIARRDPMDVGLACFRQLFAAGNETLYDLADIGAEIRRYEEMMDHWRAVLPGRVFEVRYESLVADPEGQIRRLVTQGCVLPWSPDCLAFHTTSAVVATASVDQARQPIFNGAVNRWRLYERHLGPLRSALRQSPPADADASSATYQRR